MGMRPVTIGPHDVSRRPPSARSLQGQDRQWSRHAVRYDELFLDAFDPEVENPLLGRLERIPLYRMQSIWGSSMHAVPKCLISSQRC